LKKLNCNRCGDNIGEMSKGKIKKDAVIICGKCNYALLVLEREEKQSMNIKNPFPDIINSFSKRI